MLLTLAPPDVVLLDIWMAGTGGLSILRRICARHPGLPVIMVTGHEDDLVMARATLRLGAFDHVTKPFDFFHVARVVEAALAHRGTAHGPAVN